MNCTELQERNNEWSTLDELRTRRSVNLFKSEMKRHRRWFNDTQLFSTLLEGRYEYFGTFRFREDIDMSWEQSQKSISHFKNVVRKKLFGRGDFNMDFLSVIEDKKWEKNTKRYVSVKTHFHFLISDVPQRTLLNKDFQEFLIDCWCSLQESDKREKQQVKFISGVFGIVSYLLKLRHSEKGIRCFDDVNSTHSQKLSGVDVDFGDGIEVHEITGDFVEFLDEIKESRQI